MSGSNLYYLFCNHWTQGGIGFAFPSGWHEGKKYNRTFSSAYTIHKMLDAADQYPGLKVSMELDSYLYEEVAKEDPACIRRLKDYIMDGKAGIDGGTYGQPLGQDYGWESNIRQLTYGRKAVQAVLDYDVSAFLVEEQWFHPQLPQLLKKSGFKYASLQNQNSGQVKPMNKAMIYWKGIDGSGLPAVPANDLMVSCVRQYTDYEEYKDRLKTYESPLLFQWVEVWPPGMDWGASATPFEKGIDQIKEWKGKPVTLAEYFEIEAENHDLEEVYISLDDSNYANDWYQGGGWGYDGDKVIMWDKKVESALLTYETLNTLNKITNKAPYPQKEMDEKWKKLLILQNHDFSVARTYRAITEDGVVTQAGSYGIAEYKKLYEELIHKMSSSSSLKAGNSFIHVANASGVAYKKTVPVSFEWDRQGTVKLVQSDKIVPFHITERNENLIKGEAVVDLPAVGTASIEILPCDRSDLPPLKNDVECGEGWLEDNRYKVEWRRNSWEIGITDKQTGETVSFTAFTGKIAKENEHSPEFHALSSAHEIFTFEFDGKTHSPDQNSISRIVAEVKETGCFKTSLVLKCPILTLHTTDTPVAFAEAKVTVDHMTAQIECESYFYTGVYLSLNCHAVFRHELTHAKYYRDYPFGEEETRINDIYSNSYTRAENELTGFDIIHSGTQKVHLAKGEAGGKISHLIARGTVFGEYSWTFNIDFGKKMPFESAKSARKANSCIVSSVSSVDSPLSFLEIEDPRIVFSAFYIEGTKQQLRVANYSGDMIENTAIKFANRYAEVCKCDFSGKKTGGNLIAARNNGATEVRLSLSPWEIVTFCLDDGNNSKGEPV